MKPARISRAVTSISHKTAFELPHSPAVPSVIQHYPVKPSAQSHPLFAAKPYAGLLFLLLFALFPGAFLTTHTFCLRDFPAFGLPLADYLGWSLKRGEIPLWNPFSQCGIPFAAQWNTMVFYPPMWLVSLVSPAALLSLFCVTHLLLGGIGMHRLTHRLTGSDAAAAVAGMCFTLNGICVNALMWPNNVAALGWFPWLLLCIRRAHAREPAAIRTAGIVGGLQMLTGAPEVILFTWIMATLIGLLAPLDKDTPLLPRILCIAKIAALTTCLAAIQLLPFAELLSQSERWQSAASSEWSTSPSAVLRWVAPAFDTYTTPAGPIYQAEQSWTHSTYSGLLPLLLITAALGGPLRRLAIALIVLVIWAQLASQGSSNGSFSILGAWLPMRFPVKLLLFQTFAFPLIASMGLSHCLEQPTPRRLGRQLLPGIALIALLMSITWFAIHHLSPERQPAASFSLMTRGLILVLIIFIFALLSFQHGKQGVRKHIVLPLLLILVFTDLATHQQSLAPMLSRAQLPRPHPDWTTLQPDSRIPETRVTQTAKALVHSLYEVAPTLQQRWQLGSLSLGGNFNLASRIPRTSGFFSLNPGSVATLEQTMYAGANGLHLGLLDLLAVSHIVTFTNAFAWATNSMDVSMIHIGSAPNFVRTDKVLETLSAPAFSPRKHVVLDDALSDQITAQGSTNARFYNAQFDTHKISFTTQTSHRTLATISQTWYPCWRATLNGDDVPLWPANHSFMAVEVPPGTHQIALHYEDSQFEIGRSISLATILCILAYSLRRRLCKARAAAQ